MYAVDGWERIVGEHLTALEASGLSLALGRLHLGVIGSPDARQTVAEFCRRSIVTEVVAAADEGWEQVTMRALREFTDADALLYAHTKGVTQPSGWPDDWRQAMTAAVVTGWRRCVALLEEHEAVGCHWLRPEDWPDVESPYFGGTFWWARRSLIDRLPIPSTASRHEAERWLGKGAPDVSDLAPGWPSPSSLYRA